MTKMKLIITLAISAILYLSSSLLTIPWYSGFLALLLLVVFLGKYFSNTSVFLIGCCATIISWTLAFSIGIISNGKILLSRLGDMLSMNHYLLLVFTILIAGIIGGLAAFTGAEIQIFKRNKAN